MKTDGPNFAGIVSRPFKRAEGPVDPKVAATRDALARIGTPTGRPIDEAPMNANRITHDRQTSATAEIRADAVRLIYAGIEGLAPDEALTAILTAIRDDDRFSEDQLHTHANLIGREAHERGRR
jgi:hypothetical protein